ARELAEHHRHALITPLHYLAAIAAYPHCAGHELLAAIGVTPHVLFERALAAVPSTGPEEREQGIAATFVPSDDATELVMRAKLVARERNRQALTTVDFVEGMIRLGDSLAAAILAEFGVTAARIAELLEQLSLREETAAEEQMHRQSPATVPPTELAPEQIHKLREKLAASRRQGNTERSCSDHEERNIASTECYVGAVVSSASQREPAEEGSLTPMPEEKQKTGPIVLTCDPQNPPLEVVEQAADSLLEGKLVAFPTETVYGLGVDATNLSALERLYEVKGRDRSRAIAVLIHSTAQLRHMVREIPEGVSEIMEAFWPGPLTLVFRRHTQVFQSLAPDDSIGIRMPDHYLALSILSMVGRPLATTSANLSGQPPAREAAEIIVQLGEKVDLIIDGGPSGGHAPSTVLSVMEKPYRVLRVGPISRAQLEEVGKIRIID
ncbi:MAG: L-threonylcarbamoyladenylate synthase, partial [Candidatus Sumerlaeaceae bacterium]|nr:L-threonylcarbamoyladenylate synthase [Candidatus Sumerlaeaceae bacterium]